MTGEIAGEKCEIRNGVISALSAYFIWGFFPLFFRLLDGVSPGLIVAHRTIWSLVFVAFLLAFQKRLGSVWPVFRSWKQFAVILGSALALSSNWLVFIWAVDNGRVLDSSLGYFINPLVSVAIGMLLLGERQSKWQIVAIVIAAAGFALQGIVLGSLPWVSLFLAFSFGTYGYLRKIVVLESAPGLMAETLVATPIALAYVFYTIAVGGAGPHGEPFSMGLLLVSGPMTAIVLILFAFGTRRLRLTTIGMFQYVTPSLHFIVAVWIFKEQLQPVVMLSFIMIWISLAIFTVDSFRQKKKQ